MTTRYEVTASKYRPKTLDELAGQEFVVSTIKNSLKSGQIAHAYLFSGPRGCGKTSAARILARALNCEKGLEAGPCGGNSAARNAGKAAESGICDNCRAIMQDSSMDVLEINGADNRGIENIRQIREEVLFPPHAGKYKVYIIDEVHMLTKEAFNALLKTIEEPPPYIVFIFATTELHKVPDTIKSRCQQFNFRLIPVDTIQGILKTICDENRIKAENDALMWIARDAAGSMRDAFTRFDQIVSFSEGNITSALIREKLGLIGLDKLNTLADACAANDAKGSFTFLDEILDSGVAIEQFIIDLAGYFRSLLLIKNGIVKESILGYKPEQYSAKALDIYDPVRLEQALDILLDCHRDIRYSISPRFELETAVSKLTWLSKWVSPAELKKSIDDARNVLRNVSCSKNSSSPKDDSSGSMNSSSPKDSSSPVQNGSSEETVKPAAEKDTAYQSSDSGERSLTNALHRMIAAKEAAGDSPAFSDMDDDVPMWDRSADNNAEEKKWPQVEQVLSVISGNITE